MASVAIVVACIFAVLTKHGHCRRPGNCNVGLSGTKLDVREMLDWSI